MEPAPEAPRRSGGCIGWAIGIIVLIVVVFAIVIPGLLSSGRASNDRNASSSLKTLASAEADFRSNDRDGNRVNDFWTGDVKGLYTLTSALYPGAPPYSTTDPSIKLIELSVACADVDGSMVPAGGENHPVTMFGNPSPKAGYWYVALARDLSEANPAESAYKVDTGGTPPMGSCHHTSKFGFFAFPDTVQSGPWAFILNENNTIFRIPVKKPIRTGTAIPPGVNGFAPAYRDWPDERTMKDYWSKAD